MDYEGFPGSSSGQTSEALPLKTRLIQAPEYLDEETFDKKSDIWQLGLIIFQLLTLEPMFSAKTEKKLGIQIDNLDIDSEIKQIPDDFGPLKQMIQHMVVSETDLRYDLDGIINQFNQIDD